MATQTSSLARQQTSGILEAVCRALELSKTQFETAERRYTGVGEWLAASDNRLLATAEIYPQGSMALGTTVRPLTHDEFDIDLVCHITSKQQLPPHELKTLVGKRLKENSNYNSLLSDEKPRCWRLDYANEFHMDITPSIPDANGGGELVPDKTLGQWKPTNPKGYKEWFEAHATIIPDIAILKTGKIEARADVADLPQPTRLRGPLKRIVQLCKRHRDIWGHRNSIEEPPISIILTTLAAKSYYNCVMTMSFDTELDLVEAVLRGMPDYIATETNSRGGHCFYVRNETNLGENFAERWNDTPVLARHFYSWHHSALREIPNLASAHGLDQVEESLATAFGERTARTALGEIERNISTARGAGMLGATAGIGLTTGGTAHTQIRPNTFFGR